MDTISIPQIIPILPSPHLVLFPKTHVALHIPKSFYEKVKEGSEPGELFLGIVLRKAQPMSDTMILPVGCAAKVMRCFDLSCGQTVHLDLFGLKKFRMSEGWFESGYGQARVEVMDEQPGLSLSKRKTLLETGKYLIHLKSWLAEVEREEGVEVEDDVLLNLLCLESDLLPMDKYFLLEAEDLNQRCGRLLDLLRFKYEDHH